MSLKVRAIGKDEYNKFIESQWSFYEDDPNWVPPLKMDRQKLLDEKKNPFYRHARMQLFVAEQNGRIVGRIGAIVNDNHNATHNDKVGFWGFFESINDQGVTTALFSAAEQWLRDQGMTHSRGPMSPSINDETGLLIHGFDSPPVILMTYNPMYYGQLIEGAGYGKIKDLFAYRILPETYRSEKLERLVDRINSRNNVTFRSVNLKDKTQYKKDVAEIRNIFNEAWSKNWGFVAFTDEEIEFLGDDLKQIADPELAFFVETNGKTAGFILGLPDINQVLIHNKKGGILGALWHMVTKKKQIEKVRIVILGVYPEFRRLGLDASMYHEIGNRRDHSGYKEAEAGFILEDNDMMNRGLTQTMHAERNKVYRIYEKEL